MLPTWKSTQKPWQQGIGDMDEFSQKGGSRNSDGNVPNVNWNLDNQKVNVNWYNVDNSNAANGLRSEVSAQTKIPLLCGILCYVFNPAVRHF